MLYVSCLSTRFVYLFCLDSLVKLHYYVVLHHIHIACHEQNMKTLELFVVTCGVFRGSYSCKMLPVIVTLQVSHVLRTRSLCCFDMIKCCQTSCAASPFCIWNWLYCCRFFCNCKRKIIFLFGWGITLVHYCFVSCIMLLI